MVVRWASEHHWGAHAGLGCLVTLVRTLYLLGCAAECKEMVLTPLCASVGARSFEELFASSSPEGLRVTLPAATYTRARISVRRRDARLLLYSSATLLARSIHCGRGLCGSWGLGCAAPRT